MKFVRGEAVSAQTEKTRGDESESLYERERILRQSLFRDEVGIIRYLAKEGIESLFECI